MVITVNNVKASMLGVSLSRTVEGKKEKDPARDYNLCKKELEDQLKL